MLRSLLRRLDAVVRAVAWSWVFGWREWVFFKGSWGGVPREGLQGFLDGFNGVCGAGPLGRGRPCNPTATSSNRG